MIFFSKRYIGMFCGFDFYRLNPIDLWTKFLHYSSNQQLILFIVEFNDLKAIIQNS